MIACLNDILNSKEPSSLIAPIALNQKDVNDVKFVPLCLLGLFNPMGPTLVALNLIARDGAQSGAILGTSLNPFAQSRLLFARAPKDSIGVFKLLRSLYQIGDELILGARPDVVLPSIQNEIFQESLAAMLWELLSSVPSHDHLSKANRSYREHWKDPWSRIPSMEEMMSEATLKKGTSPICEKPTRDDFGEWFSIVTDPNHVASDLAAIVEAWDGSIGMAPGLSHMPMNEAASELATLGFPYFTIGSR